MKKLLYIALVVATAFGFTSCEEKEEEAPQDEVDNYIGTLVVTNMTDTTADTYTKPDVTFDFDDDTNTLTMWGVAFAENMPVSVDIVIANVPETADDFYSIDSISATLEDGSPAPTFISDLTDVTISDANDALTVRFNVDVTSYGPTTTTTTYKVNYDGLEK